MKGWTAAVTAFAVTMMVASAGMIGWAADPLDLVYAQGVLKSGTRSSLTQAQVIPTTHDSSSDLHAQNSDHEVHWSNTDSHLIGTHYHRQSTNTHTTGSSWHDEFHAASTQWSPVGTVAAFTRISEQAGVEMATMSSK